MKSARFLSKRFLWFFLGAACFIISQPLLRLPVLVKLHQSTDFMLIYALNPLLIGILIAFSAGLFEEGFRFLFKQFLLKPVACPLAQPIIFGLGHGIAEAVYVLGPAFQLIPLAQLELAVLERILAIILHVSLTVIVWNGFQKGQRGLYLLLAIAVHGGIDSLIPLLISHPNATMLIEGALFILDVGLIVYVWRSGKYYVKGELA